MEKFTIRLLLICMIFSSCGKEPQGTGKAINDVSAINNEDVEGTEFLDDLPPEAALPPYMHFDCKNDPAGSSLRDAYHQYRRYMVIKGFTHALTEKAYQAFTCLAKIQAGSVTLPADMNWAYEKFHLDQTDSLLISDFPLRLKSWLSGQSQARFQDQALNFTETNNNKLEYYPGVEAFHQKLFTDLANAKKSIHVQMFGWHPDEYGHELGRRLAERAKDGLQVRVLIDKTSAGLSFIKVLKKKKDTVQVIIDDMRAAGVEVILSNAGFFKLDHRKQYIMDGQVAWSTGYTVNLEQRYKTSDAGTRMNGDVVRQIQATFFASWLAWGGQFKDVDLAQGTSLEKYFPPPIIKGQAEVTLVSNIPKVQHEVSESYYRRIAGANKEVIVASRQFADPQLISALLQARKNGAEVTVIVQENISELMGIYSSYIRKSFKKFKEVGIKSYLFYGKEKYGFIHAKIVIADGYVSTGSCNLDLPSLKHNGEQNIETSDAEFYKQVKRYLTDDVIQFSKPYVVPKESFFKKLKFSMKDFVYKLYDVIL